MKASISKTGKVLAALILSIIASVSLGNAQQKIGYVDSEKILAELPVGERGKGLAGKYRKNLAGRTGRDVQGLAG